MFSEKKGLAVPDELRDLDIGALSRGERGILSYVIEQLKNESSTSCVRFWITRALEAFLRCETCPLNQSFLIRKRLVEVSGVLLRVGFARYVKKRRYSQKRDEFFFVEDLEKLLS